MKAMSSSSASVVAEEFAKGWRIVLGSVLGIAVGVVGLPSLAIALSMTQLQEEFSWSRTQISLGPTLIVGVLAITAPFVGAVADRVRAVWIATFSLACLALAFFCLARLGPDVRFYYAGCVAMALLGAGASTLVYARIVSAAFIRGRGLALGIAMLGNGITSALLPVLLVPYIAQRGWRSGFIVMMGIILVSIPIIGFLISKARDSAAGPRRGTGGSAEAVSGIDFSTAIRSQTLWVFVTCFASITLAAAGFNFHFVAFLKDTGVEPGRIGAHAGLIGISLIASRLVTGWLLDRFVALHVAAAMMLLSALGLAAVGFLGAGGAPLGALAIGLSIGSEIDLIAYFTARHFGMRAYGRIYGVQYSACLVGGAISPVLYGKVVDASASYYPAIWGGSIILLACAGMFLWLQAMESARVPAGEPA